MCEKPMAEMDATKADFLESLCGKVLSHANIPASLYEEYDIKRGLRNADGTGVMAGVSRVGSVQGYVVRDGERVPAPGQLYYRGINVAEIVNGFWNEGRQGMAETAYLLLFGELPSKAQHQQFCQLLMQAAPLPDNWAEDIFLKVPSKDYMNLLARSVLALYACDPKADDTSLPNLLAQSIRLIGAFPSIISSAYAALNGHYSASEIGSDPMGRSLAENFLFRLREDHEYTEEEARLLDLCLVLHAEHGGGNNSTFTCRVLTSSGTDTYSAIAGAISSLKGPLHGGANIRVCRMMQDMKAKLANYADEEEILRYLNKILNKEAFDKSGKIYGIGHAIYTQSDPRAVLLKQYARKLVASQSEGMQQEFALMERVEKLAPKAFENFKGGGKVVAANVDFYSGFIYRMLGIPEELFTPLFAMARVSGWAAHRLEETLIGGRIIRPAYKAYELENAYSPMQQR